MYPEAASLNPSFASHCRAFANWNVSHIFSRVVCRELAYPRSPIWDMISLR
jgi:hypothetical protein